MSATTAILPGDEPVRQERKPKSIVFLPKSPWTKPYNDESRDAYEDALQIREIARRQGGMIAAKTRRELAALAQQAKIPFTAVDRALDRATWAGVGAPDKNGYRFFLERPPAVDRAGELAE